MAMKKDDMDETPAPAPPPDPWVVLDRLTRAMEAMASQPKSDRTDQLIETLSGALARVAETQLEAGKLVADETRRAARPSNQVVPGISVFNRRGLNLAEDAEGPRKPPLKCIMMIPWLAEWESMTREEVELLNLLQAGTYVVKKIDDTKIKMTVQIDYGIDDITPSRLVITHETAFNNDYFKLMPSLSSWLRQMLRQHDPETARAANAVLSDDEEAAMIEAGALSVSA